MRRAFAAALLALMLFVTSAPFAAVAAPTGSITWVVDHTSKALDVEAGVGVGLTSGSDKLTLKLILSRDLK